MSIFKTIGNKLKRVISIKNALNIATGNLQGVGADVKRVLTTPDPKSKNKNDPSTQVVTPNFEIPQVVNDVLQSQGIQLSNKMASSIGMSKIATDNVNKVNSFFTKIWWAATWEKNKALIIGFAVLIVGFLILLFKKPKRRARR